jgi:hypothetical protein
MELKKGDPVTVDGYCAKDGRKLFGGFQSTPGAPAQ